MSNTFVTGFVNLC